MPYIHIPTHLSKCVYMGLCVSQVCTLDYTQAL